MNLDRAFNIAAAIVGVAMITVIVTGRNSAQVISSVGDAFSGSLRAAMGR